MKSCIIAHTSSESYLKGSLRCCLDICLVHQKEKVVVFVGTAYYLHIYCLPAWETHYILLIEVRSWFNPSEQYNLFSEHTCMQAFTYCRVFTPITNYSTNISYAELKCLLVTFHSSKASSRLIPFPETCIVIHQAQNPFWQYTRTYYFNLLL